MGTDHKPPEEEVAREEVMEEVGVTADHRQPRMLMLLTAMTLKALRKVAEVEELNALTKARLRTQTLGSTNSITCRDLKGTKVNSQPTLRFQSVHPRSRSSRSLAKASSNQTWQTLTRQLIRRERRSSPSSRRKRAFVRVVSPREITPREMSSTRGTMR